MLSLLQSYFRGKSLRRGFRPVNSNKNRKPDLSMPVSCSELDWAIERCIELEEGVGEKEGEMVMIMMTMSQSAAAPQLNLMAMSLLCLFL